MHLDSSISARKINSARRDHPIYQLVCYVYFCISAPVKRIIIYLFQSSSGENNEINKTFSSRFSSILQEKFQVIRVESAKEKKLSADFQKNVMTTDNKEKITFNIVTTSYIIMLLEHGV